MAVLVKAADPSAGDKNRFSPPVARCCRPQPHMTDFTGKHGLIVGVANKRSISWAIAQAVARRGARLALTYQGRSKSTSTIYRSGLEQPPLILPCDVSSDAEITSVFEKVDQEFGD